MIHKPGKLFWTAVAAGTLLAAMLLAPCGAAFGEEGIEELPAVAPKPPRVRIVGEGNTLWDLFRHGGVLMWPIAVCSVIGLAFIFERFVELRRSKNLPSGFVEDVAHIVDTRGVDAGLAYCLGNRIGMARVLYASLLRYGTSRQEMETAIEIESRMVRYDLMRNCRVLGLLSKVAPMLGLLGAVTGTIDCLDWAADMESLGTGLAQALLPAAFGLIVAIPLYLCYQIFANRAEDFVREIEELAVDFVVTLDRKARRSMRLVQDIEEDLETKAMPAAVRLDDEFEEEDLEKNAKTAIAPPPAFVPVASGSNVPQQIPTPSEIASPETDESSGKRRTDTRAATLPGAVPVISEIPVTDGKEDDEEDEPVEDAPAAAGKSETAPGRGAEPAKAD